MKKGKENRAILLVLLIILMVVLVVQRCGAAGSLGLSAPVTVYPANWQWSGSCLNNGKGTGWDFSTGGWQVWVNPLPYQPVWVLEVVVKVRVRNLEGAAGYIDVRVERLNGGSLTLIDDGFASEDDQVREFRWEAGDLWGVELIVGQGLGLNVEGSTDSEEPEPIVETAWVTYSWIEP